MSRVIGFTPDFYRELTPFVTPERLDSYVRAGGGDLLHAFALYEWNMRAAAGLMELSCMLEVVVRNALDRELQEWARRSSASASWFDLAPLDRRGSADLRKARDRGRTSETQAERHGRVIAELTLGFWRYLVESRYLTTLWVPALHRAFPHGAVDLRARQKAVAFHLQQLHFVRNRAAHHEPIHRRDLGRDLEIALELAEWISPTAARWVNATTMMSGVLTSRP